MIGQKVLSVVGVALLLLAAHSSSASRAFATEVGYFAADGTMNGSITYPCEGGRWIEGQLVGTPREIDRWPCICEDGPDGNGYYCGWVDPTIP